MKKVLGWMVTLLLVAGVNSVGAEGMTADQILTKADDVSNAPKDSSQTIQILLKDKTGQQKERKLELLQKGSDRRMIRFLSPADQKGIGFLSLPDDVMYLYLPAFKKTRRIASHIKNTKFAGTDYTYEDLEAKRYSDQWIPTLQKNDNDAYVLELTLKPNAKSDYSKMVMTVRKDNYYVSRLEMADKTGKLVKILTRDKIEQIGAYWIAKESLMEDLKEQHKTKMNVQDVLLDQSLGDNKFSERYLSE